MNKTNDIPDAMNMMAVNRIQNRCHLVNGLSTSTVIVFSLFLLMVVDISLNGM